LTHPFNWKKASMAAALCYGVRGGGAQLAFQVTAGNYDTDTLIEVLSELRRFLGGEKATLLWDGLPAHRSRAMRVWLATQRSWLVVERLPAYAPELNPTEGLWANLKAVELANLTSPTLAEVIDQAHKGVDRVRRTPHLAYSFLRHAGLSVSEPLTRGQGQGSLPVKTLVIGTGGGEHA
jgi:transposase